MAAVSRDNTASSLFCSFLNHVPRLSECHSRFNKLDRFV